VRRLALLACTASIALAPSAAEAAIVPGATVDGPSANILASGNTVQSDVAPDGTAAIAYLKVDGAFAHVWVSRLVAGAWTVPEQIDVGFVGNSSAPRIAVANGGKIVVTFVSGTNVFAAIKPNAGNPFGAPADLTAIGSDYAQVDLAPGGNGYVAIHQGFNVVVKRLEGTTFSNVNGGAAIDNVLGEEAGGSDLEAKVVTGADGAGGAIAWGEGPGGATTVFARQITGTTVGAAADAKLTALDGAPDAATGLLMPDISIDGAGTAWVVFRQFFTYTGNFGRAIARPLPLGGTFGPPQVVDGLASPPTENVEYPRVDVNATGQGLSANYLGTTVGVHSASLSAGAWTRGSLVNDVTNTGTAFASPASAENGNGLVSWRNDPDGAGTEVTRILARTTLGGFGPRLTLSDPTLGDLPGAQLVSAAGTNFAVVGYVQGGAGGTDPRRIGAAVVDLPLPGGGNPPTKDTTKPKLSKLKLSAKRFRIGSKLATAAAVRTGTTIRYTLSEAATVTLSFQRVSAGRKVGKRCVKPKRSNRRRKRCTRFAAVKPAVTFANQAAGARRIHFEGRLSRRKTLKPGVYRLTLRARDTAGNRSTGLTSRITVLPKRKRAR